MTKDDKESIIAGIISLVIIVAFGTILFIAARVNICNL